MRLAKLRAVDHARHSKLLRTLNAARHYFQAQLEGGSNAASRLATALAFSEHPLWDQRITSSLMTRFAPESNAELWSQVVAGLPRYRQLIKADPQLTRSIILKAPGINGEKGVLLMYFEYNWVRLALGMTNEEFAWIDQHFDLILSTSWSPTDYASLALLLAKTQGPVFVQPCNFSETEKLSGFHPRISVLNSLPCDWIDPQFYPPTPKQERDIDFLMVANWGEFKRHWDFFDALRKLPAHLRVVLVGQSEAGRDADFIRHLAARIGVPQTLEIHQSIPISEVSALQSRAKVSLIFTRREGCCVASVESLFAGCALGMRADAHIGPLHYIHAETGLRLRPGHLSEDLLRLLEMSEKLDPTTWAAEHISCHQTHAKLNTHLRATAQDRGLPWTRDLALPHWRPYPRHAHPEDAASFAPLYQDLHTRFPTVFGRDLLQTSVR